MQFSKNALNEIIFVTDPIYWYILPTIGFGKVKGAESYLTINFGWLVFSVYIYIHR